MLVSTLVVCTVPVVGALDVGNSPSFVRQRGGYGKRAQCARDTSIVIYPPANARIHLSSTVSYVRVGQRGRSNYLPAAMSSPDRIAASRQTKQTNLHGSIDDE